MLKYILTRIFIKKYLKIYCNKNILYKIMLFLTPMLGVKNN
jgi:hypothetical protein